MRASLMYQDFVTTIKELTFDPSPPHRHHYFELIYVLKGSGVHQINAGNYNYERGNLFLLTPEDEHTFKPHADTAFFIIDFTKNFFLQRSNKEQRFTAASDLFEKLEYIFHNQERLKGDVITGERDKEFAGVLIERLMGEKENPAKEPDNMVKNIVFLLLDLIARSIRQQVVYPLKRARTQQMIHEIINYVQQNVYYNDLIKVEQIAAQFHKTKDYISLYFKKQTGINLKDFIINYKIELVKTRLLYSDLTISEIASELGFTDESHLNKTFKKKFGQTANHFRSTH
jgi:AraC family L-rhamnose operon regulatory protein RhaS